MSALADGPINAPRVATTYGHYEESDGRMSVQVYRGTVTVPVGDRFQLSYSATRDTYSGATPAYNIPATLTGQTQYRVGDDGQIAANAQATDVVSAATGQVTAGTLTVLGGLNTYTRYVDNYAAQAAAFQSANPPPAPPPTVPTIPGPVTLDFQALNLSAYFGQANVPLNPDGSCQSFGTGCYAEDGVLLGVVADSTNPVAHLHRGGSASDRALSYHADSSGIYVRAADGAAFGLLSMDFQAALSGANPDSGPTDFWNIVGFSSAVNPTLDVSPSAPTQVALQTVANGFSGTLTLAPSFANINAFWIYFNGYPQTPTDGKAFELDIDDVQLTNVSATSTSAEQEAYALALDRAVSIALYQAILDSAVPDGTPTVLRRQTQPRETREAQDLQGRWFLDDLTLEFGVGQSLEPDFTSRYGSLRLAWELPGGQSTLAATYGYTSNDVGRTTNGAGHTGHRHGDADAYEDAELDARNQQHSASISLSHILGKDTLWQGTAGHSRQSGFLSNPYKLVYVRGELTAEEYYEISQLEDYSTTDFSAFTGLEVVGIDLFRERRPDVRAQWFVSNRINQYLPALDASLHADYRWYRDDWGVDAHTLQLDWYQQAGRAMTITPRMRYYSQSAADFYADYFLAPRADGLYSSDYRLSGFGALNFGVDIARQVTSAVRLDLGLDYYIHRGALKLGSGGEDDFADFESWLAQATLTVDLERPLIGDGGGHEGHPVSHANHLPAGIMFGHTLHRARDFMLGYRFQWTAQDGPLQAGRNALDQNEVIARGCAGTPCSSAPRSMSMTMHMLDIMYAPTDRLTLMLMPQIMSMEMDMEPLTSGGFQGVHTGRHVSDGLGDTVGAALYRAASGRFGELTLGLGVSAPTGSVEVDFDGDEATLDELQDYGMQLGSGTWDLRPSATLAGSAGGWLWGSQLNGTVRLEERNRSGYALGDVFQASAWAGRRLAPWLDATVRTQYTSQGRIRGAFNRPSSDSAPVDFPENHGGRHLDVGVGMTMHSSAASAAIEWLQPVTTDQNGVQLGRDGQLSVTVGYHF